ncbi:hypothetical protein [Amaricoccus tamworthensis]|uniref:aldose epimerase family protein n=1 Tax=Amaricoccus tamworthensis TaxID=57002 RepID=UPI003C7D0558
MIELSSDRLNLSVDPDQGASIRSLDLVTASGRLPILAAACPSPQDAGQSALFPMSPFANRVRDNRLTIAGRTADLSPNTDDPLCLHGWAWHRPWHVAQVETDQCHLTLRLLDHGYNLSLGYRMRLSETGLTLSLRAVNDGSATVPVGLGFHPFFPRHPDTTLRFEASTLWPEGPGHLPMGHVPVPDAADYKLGRSLPAGWRNECYSGWKGTANISQPCLEYDLTLTSIGTTVLMFYADPALNRFAVEPQSHVSGETHTGPNGLTALRPKQEYRIAMTLSVHPHSSGPLHKQNVAT